MPDTNTPERAAALNLLADYATVYAGLPEIEQVQRIHPTTLVDAATHCLRKYKGRIVWRKSPPPDAAGQDATTFYTFHRAHRLANERDVWNLMMLNHAIGRTAYVQWATTFDTLRTIERVRAKA